MNNLFSKPNSIKHYIKNHSDILKLISVMSLDNQLYQQQKSLVLLEQQNFIQQQSNNYYFQN
ncbi:unnamed protein product [Paramecium sonneborni]|uniref:Uncharacterized protein n=1 Tax=Paramecium sonneborni TaxID=65129 RepID=A0A8S1PUB8_9CILI|nr:unnamed protein product [Paramecium sonneborni]